MHVKRVVVIQDDTAGTVKLSWKEAVELSEWLAAHGAELVMTDEGGAGNVPQEHARAIARRKNPKT